MREELQVKISLLKRGCMLALWGLGLLVAGWVTAASGGMATGYRYDGAAGAPAGPVSSSIVVSQLYGGGGSLGAPYQNDFIELFNPHAFPVVMAGWSVQYASATGTNWQRTILSLYSAQPYRQVATFSSRRPQAAATTLPCPSPTPSVDQPLCHCRQTRPRRQRRLPRR